jgi:phosphatidylglycerol:prolipoprotein diacylglycerol transferase
MELVNFRNGGLGIYGAIIGAALGMWIYARRQRILWSGLADLAAVAAPLAQWLGRWGNFFNQELYGQPTTLPWGIFIDNPLGRYAEGTRFHPTFLYESLWSLATFVLLYGLFRSQRLRSGELAGLYLIAYAFGRIVLETIRLDSRLWQDSAVPIATLVSIGIIVVTLLLMAIRRALAARSTA